MQSMVKCHNHAKIMDSLFEEEENIGENRQLDISIDGYNFFWTWVGKKVGWLR